MIRESFVHLPGIGKTVERRLWQAGISDWTGLASTSLGKNRSIMEALQRSEAELLGRDLKSLFERFPPDERWRLFSEFESDFVGVDIETTGLSIYDILTVVGVESSHGYRAFIHGSNLEEVREVLESARGLITFNGTLFDLPFLRRAFPSIRLPDVHLDLRFLGRRAGFRGSLKRVERLAGIGRDDDLDGLTSYSAVVLWNEYQQGNLESLARLVRYNAADTANLRQLCRVIVGRLAEALRSRIAEVSYQFPLFSGSASSMFMPTAIPVVPAQYADINFSGATLYVDGMELQAEAEQKPPSITLASLLARMPDPTSRIVGIDLSGSEDRRTGWALLEGTTVSTAALKTTDDIVRYTLASKPTLVSIDSPLSIPAGRDCTIDDCACRVHGISRSSERELKRRGVSVYWCLIQSMQALTRRGMRLAAHLREAGIQVIESYPGAAQDIMRIPRKGTSRGQLRDGLIRFGVDGIPPISLITHDELDAATSAIVGSFFLAQMYEPLGNEAEGYLIVPDLDAAAAAGVTDLNVVPPAIGGETLLVIHGDRDRQVSGFFYSLGYSLGLSFECRPPESGTYGKCGKTITAVSEDCADIETAVRVFGPRVRHIVALYAGERFRRSRLPQCDVVLDLAAPSWTTDLEAWLRRYDAKGTTSCHSQSS